MRHHPNSAQPGRLATNITILLIAAAVPAVGRLMSFDAAGTVRLSATPVLSLPTLCPSRWIGLRCLTCGVTRSIIALMHGDGSLSVAQHPFGWLIFAQIVAQIPYRAVRIMHPLWRSPLLERLAIVAITTTLTLTAATRIIEAVGR